MALVLASLVVIILVIGCGDDDEQAETPNPSIEATDAPAPTPTAVPETLKVGVNAELTGPYAGYMSAYLKGLEFAVQEINEAGGIKAGGKRYVLELVIRDNALDPARAVANATELIRDEGIRFIFGPISDLTFEPSYVLAKENGVLALGTASLASQNRLTDDPLTENPNLFVSFAPIKYIAAIYAGISSDFLDGERLALLVDDSPSSVLLGEQWEDAAAGAGFEVVALEKYPLMSTTDFSTIMTKIKSDKPDILWASTVVQGTSILKAAEEIEAADAYVTGLIDPEVLLGEATGNPITRPLYVVNQTLWFSDLAIKPEHRAFGDKVAEAFGEPIGTVNEPTFVGTYYQLRMLAIAMEKADSVDDVDAVSRTLEGLSWKGPLGSASMNGHFLVVPPAYFEYRDGAVAQVCIVPDPEKPAETECAPPLSDRYR